MLESHYVTLADINKDALNRALDKNPELSIHLVDVTNKKQLEKLIAPFDLVICAVPGFLGFQTLKIIIQSKKNVVDISFFPENSLELDTLAKENNITAIVDCGVAPGMGNIILGYYDGHMKLTDFECLVGGLPKVKKWPFNYKAPFSPIDVIEEYTRPARYVENGSVIVKEPLSDCEIIDFDKVGSLESFNSDGLRSLIYTMPHIRNMKEKTLRYPGHAEYISVLKESGFFDTEKIKIGEHYIAPIDFSSQLLFKEWKLNDLEEELTIMRIRIQGSNKEGQTQTIIYNLYDEYCKESYTSSMSRTTGYTATAVANLFLDGRFPKKGIFPPEFLGRHEGCFQYILKYLSARNVIYKMEIIEH